MGKKKAELDHVDDFLAHYGVKGMKWGRRGVGESKADRRKANRKTLQKAGEQRLKDNGGSRGKAISKSVGKMLITNLLTNTGMNLVSSLAPNSTGLRLGAAAAATVLQGVAIGKTVNEIRAVNEATRARDSKNN